MLLLVYRKFVIIGSHLTSKSNINNFYIGVYFRMSLNSLNIINIHRRCLSFAYLLFQQQVPLL